jgi:hypothetical protein
MWKSPGLVIPDAALLLASACDGKAVVTETDPAPRHRHCERSEAIHPSVGAERWIASSLSLLAMTGSYEFNERLEAI